MLALTSGSVVNGSRVRRCFWIGKGYLVVSRRIPRSKIILWRLLDDGLGGRGRGGVFRSLWGRVDEEMGGEGEGPG
jgi:hypothetical protein